MKEELRALLLDNAGVSGIVGTRVDWGARPQGAALPAVVLYTISETPGYHLTGADALDVARVQVDCLASKFAGATLLSRAVIAALGGYRGGGFRGVFHLSTRDDREGGANEADRPFRVSLDFNVNWKGSV